MRLPYFAILAMMALHDVVAAQGITTSLDKNQMYADPNLKGATGLVHVKPASQIPDKPVTNFTPPRMAWNNEYPDSVDYPPAEVDFSMSGEIMGNYAYRGMQALTVKDNKVTRAITYLSTGGQYLILTMDDAGVVTATRVSHDRFPDLTTLLNNETTRTAWRNRLRDNYSAAHPAHAPTPAPISMAASTGEILVNAPNYAIKPKTAGIYILTYTDNSGHHSVDVKRVLNRQLSQMDPALIQRLIKQADANPGTIQGDFVAIDPTTGSFPKDGQSFSSFTISASMVIVRPARTDTPSDWPDNWRNQKP